MKRTTPVVLGLAAVALLGAGAWLGRSSTTPPSAAPRPAEARSARIAAAVQPPTRAVPATRLPSLQPRGTTTTPGLSADLIHDDPKVRRAAVRELVRDPAVDPALVLAAARDRDLEVGVLATHALGSLYASGRIGVGEMIAVATEPGLNARVQVNALNALAMVPAPETAAHLAGLLASGSTLERSTAAILLVHQDPEAAVPALIRALSDADDNVRSNALESLRSRSRGRDFGTDAGAWAAWWQSRPR